MSCQIASPPSCTTSLALTHELICLCVRAGGIWLPDSPNSLLERGMEAKVLLLNPFLCKTPNLEFVFVTSLHYPATPRMHEPSEPFSIDTKLYGRLPSLTVSSLGDLLVSITCFSHQKWVRQASSCSSQAPCLCIMICDNQRPAGKAKSWDSERDKGCRWGVWRSQISCQSRSDSAQPLEAFLLQEVLPTTGPVLCCHHLPAVDRNQHHHLLCTPNLPGPGVSNKAPKPFLLPFPIISHCCFHQTYRPG